MAELLRIQPQARQLDPGQVRVPVPGGAYVGRGLQELGQGFGEVSYGLQHAQQGADKAEATRSALEGQQEFKNILQDTANNFPDRDEYRTEATARVKEAYQRRYDAASPGAKPLIKDSLSNEIVQHLGKGGSIDQQYWGKTIDKAGADYTAAKDQLMRAAIADPSDENRRAVGRMFGDLVGDMTRSNYMKREKGAEELVNFNKTVEAESMNLEAAQNPVRFIRKQQTGAYDGRDSTAVQRALGIAISVGDARARKDAAETKLMSDAAYRGFELQAGDHNLDISPGSPFREAQRHYAWDDNKVNDLVKMQTGLKAANPYELVTIRDAMQPVDTKGIVTMADIQEADRRLDNAVKGKQADVRTPEYVAAKRHLQNLRESLDRTYDIKARHSTWDARTEIDDLYREHGKPSNKRQREEMDRDKSRSKREVSDLPPAEQKTYVDKLKKRLETGSQKTPERQLPLDDLRSINPKR